MSNRSRLKESRPQILDQEVHVMRILQVGLPLFKRPITVNSKYLLLSLEE